MTDILLTSTARRVATLILNRPEQSNALSPELASALIQQVRRADADPAVKCILIKGAGEHLCAGGDIKGFREALSLSAEERYDVFERKLALGNRLPMTLLQTRKPIVVVARGAVAGAGMTLCLAADYVLAGAGANFCAAHVHVGLSLDCGLSGLLVAAMGIKAAKRLALLGERIDANEAQALGLVTRVLPEAELEPATEKLVDAFANGPATAMAASKALLNEAAFASLAQQLKLEAEAVARCAATEDFRYGLEAMLKRQRPKFE
jgi:2-(1,2-epoxy-1,2-dihydrophenyl)acetyl-CoA isomerase